MSFEWRLTIVTSGTTLQRLWRFAHEFQVAQASAEEIPRELDHEFKKRIWKYLAKREELVLKNNSQVLPASADGIQDLETVLQKYNDSLILLASEEKQWRSITGLPQNGNPVYRPSSLVILTPEIPKMNFNLLSCISQARAAGVTQSEAARISKQDPRSFPARTKLLVEHGLMCISLMNPLMLQYQNPHSPQRKHDLSTHTFALCFNLRRFSGKKYLFLSDSDDIHATQCTLEYGASCIQ